MDFSASAATKDAARLRRRRFCTPPRFFSTLPHRVLTCYSGVIASALTLPYNSRQRFLASSVQAVCTGDTNRSRVGCRSAFGRRCGFTVIIGWIIELTRNCRQTVAFSTARGNGALSDA
jgi:hypothetical protein